MLKGKDCYYDMPGIFRSLEDIEALTYDHLHNDTDREELQGQPKLLGLAGPMYNGEIDGLPVIRYEKPIKDHALETDAPNPMCRYCEERTAGACEGTKCSVWTRMRILPQKGNDKAGSDRSLPPGNRTNRKTYRTMGADHTQQRS